jgi:Fe-S-cluster containining protein
MYPEPKYFFDEGLYFQCQGCGACCTGAPGTIYVGPGEIGPMAAHVGLDASEFKRRYLYPYKESFSIREDRRGNCLFFDHGCTIYPVRPFQCRAFPFWFDNVRSRSRWRDVARQCPGIGKGKHYSRAEIIALAQETRSI